MILKKIKIHQGLDYLKNHQPLEAIVLEKKSLPLPYLHKDLLIIITITGQAKVKFSIKVN